MDRDVAVGVKILFFGIAGIVLAAIEYLAYTGGVLVDEFVTGSQTITIENIMSFTIVLMVIAGAAYAAATR